MVRLCGHCLEPLARRDRRRRDRRAKSQIGCIAWGPYRVLLIRGPSAEVALYVHCLVKTVFRLWRRCLLIVYISPGRVRMRRPCCLLTCMTAQPMLVVVVLEGGRFNLVGDPDPHCLLKTITHWSVNQ